MLKYVNTQVVLSEVPDEITLAINISGCPNHCEGCHSFYLAEDIGEPLTCDALQEMIDSNSGITCVSFMGGDQDPEEVMKLAEFVKESGLKTCWYSGRDYSGIELKNLDYAKFGPWKKECGPLSYEGTNQRMYTVKDGKPDKDITSWFQR